MPYRADFLWDVLTLTVGAEIVELCPSKGTSFNGPNPGITLQYSPSSLPTGGVDVFDVFGVVYPVGFAALVEELRFSPTRSISLQCPPDGQYLFDYPVCSVEPSHDHPMTNEFGVATQR